MRLVNPPIAPSVIAAWWKRGADTKTMSDELLRSEQECERALNQYLDAKRAGGKDGIATPA